MNERLVFPCTSPFIARICYHLPVLAAWVIFLFPSQTSSLFFEPPIHHHLLGAPPHRPEVAFPHKLYRRVLSPVPDSELPINKTISNSYIHPAINSPQQASEVGMLLFLLYRHGNCILKKAVNLPEVAQRQKGRRTMPPASAQPILLTLMLGCLREDLRPSRLHTTPYLTIGVLTIYLFKRMLKLKKPRVLVADKISETGGNANTS